MALGGQFDAFGILEKQALFYHGLKKTDYLIDVGCGSGRLAKLLSEYLDGKYLGIDIVPQLVNYARKLVPRSDWRFQVASGLTIDEADGQADMVCFFSVLTHLLHEESFVISKRREESLKTAERLSFHSWILGLKSHWQFFEANIKDMELALNHSICSSAWKCSTSGQSVWNCASKQSKTVRSAIYRCPPPSLSKTDLQFGTLAPWANQFAYSFVNCRNTPSFIQVGMS